MMLCFVGWLLLYVVIGFAGAGDKQKNKKKIREKKQKGLNRRGSRRRTQKRTRKSEQKGKQNAREVEGKENHHKTWDEKAYQGCNRDGNGGKINFTIPYTPRKRTGKLKISGL